MAKADIGGKGEDGNRQQFGPGGFRLRPAADEFPGSDVQPGELSADQPKHDERVHQEDKVDKIGFNSDKCEDKCRCQASRIVEQQVAEAEALEFW